MPSVHTASAAPHLIDSSKQHISLCCNVSWDSNFLSSKRGLEYPAGNEWQLQEKCKQHQIHDERMVGKVGFRCPAAACNDRLGERPRHLHHLHISHMRCMPPRSVGVGKVPKIFLRFLLTSPSSWLPTDSRCAYRNKLTVFCTRSGS